MSNNKRYRFKKTQADAIEGQAVRWSESDGMYYYTKVGPYENRHSINFLTKGAVEYNRDLFEEEKEQERIEVSGFVLEEIKDYFGRKDCKYTLATTHKIPEEKYPLIKKAIERVLNETDPCLLTTAEYFQAQYLTLKATLEYSSKQFTEEDIKDAIWFAIKQYPEKNDRSMAIHFFTHWKSQRNK